MLYMSLKSQNIHKFSYIDSANFHRTYANFFLTPAELGIAGASSLLGGALYGGSYVGTKKLMGENLTDDQAHRELAANTSAGAVSGLGGFLLTKALNRKVGLQ